MRVNITFPVFNEEGQLAENVRRVARFVSGLSGYSWEFIIADNGSSDHTLEQARLVAREWDPRHLFPSTREGALRAHAVGVRSRSEPGEDDPGERRRAPGVPEDPDFQVRILHWDQPGRGRALQGAWLASRADILTYMDIDLSTDLAHLPGLIAVVAEGKADLAIGSRLSASAQVKRGWKRELLSRGYNRLLQAMLGLEVADAQCGFKALSRAAARALLPRVRDPGFFFDTELLVLAQREGWRIHELPVRWVDDLDSRVDLARTIGRDLQGIWRLMRT